MRAARGWRLPYHPHEGPMRTPTSTGWRFALGATDRNPPDPNPMPAILTALRADAIRVTHGDVHYEPVGGDAALGALLFALDLLGRDAVDVAAMRYADRVALGPALDAARQYGLILERHVDRTDRSSPLLPVSVRIDDLHAWVHAAAAAVPEAERGRFCWRLVRRLGADPWCDGRPAIALANQQSGMFEEGFEEVGRGAAAADAEAALEPDVEPDEWPQALRPARPTARR
jgi:hypothetical protein